MTECRDEEVRLAGIMREGAALTAAADELAVELGRPPTGAAVLASCPATRTARAFRSQQAARAGSPAAPRRSGVKASPIQRRLWLSQARQVASAACFDGGCPDDSSAGSSSPGGQPFLVYGGNEFGLLLSSQPTSGRSRGEDCHCTCGCTQTECTFTAVRPSSKPMFTRPDRQASLARVEGHAFRHAPDLRCSTAAQSGRVRCPSS